MSIHPEQPPQKQATTPRPEKIENERLRKYWWAPFLLVLGVWAIFAYAAYKWFELSAENGWATAGQSGDMFGSLNALFSGLAFAGVLLALRMQHNDISLQCSEMEETRDEMKYQTALISRQVEVGAIQTLYATMPAYIQHMEMCWQQIPEKDAEMGVIREKCEELAITLNTLLTCASWHYVAEDTAKMPQIIAPLHKSLIPFMPWANVVYRWSEKVDRYLNNEQDRIDAKRTLLLELDDEKRNILWLCHLAEGRLGEGNEIPYLPFSDFCPGMDIYKALASAPNKHKNFAVQEVGIELNLCHRAKTASEEEKRQLERQFFGDSQQRCIELTEKARADA